MKFFQKNNKDTSADASSSFTDRPEDPYQLGFKSRDSLLTLESDFTQENRYGAGRTLGRLTSFFGGKLEGRVNSLAVKNGRTPAAVQAQLEEIGRKLEWPGRPYGDYSKLSGDDVRLMEGLCRKLLRWVR